MIHDKRPASTSGVRVIALATAVGLLLCVNSSFATPMPKAAARPTCKGSATSMYSACNYDAADNFWINTAKCQNVAASSDRIACDSETRTTYQSDLRLCGAQSAERVDVCKDLGPAPYDPQVVPANFVNPLDVGGAVAANPYLILTPGYTRIYNSPNEVITITMTHDTIDVLGVTCLVSRDTVRDLNGNLVEDTVDYFAQDLQGNVWYFGETTAEYENGFPVTVDGTFKAGVERAKSGIAMLAAPTAGRLYREEFALGSAEDLAQVISITATESAPAASCQNTCLQTNNFTPIKPGISEQKFYAPGIGAIVSFPDADPNSREVLVSYHY